MKKQSLCLLAILLSALGVPGSLCAQKNLLPAAKTAFGKNTVQTALGKQAAGRALGQTAANAACRQAAGAAFGKTLERASIPQAAAKVPPGILTLPSAKLKTQIYKSRWEKISHEQWEKLNQPLSPEQQKQNQQIAAQIQAFRTKNRRYMKNWVFTDICVPMPYPTPFALKNNKMVLALIPKIIQKMAWLELRPNQGRSEMVHLYTGVLPELTRKLSQEKLIMLGEVHNSYEIQRLVKQLIVKLKFQNPGRRVVLFTEFVEVPPMQKTGQQNYWSSYYRRFSEKDIQPVLPHPLFSYAGHTLNSIIKQGIEVYPLEDRQLFDLVYDEQDYRFESETSLLANAYRNKTWARIMETKMAEIRQTDPDALFIVYAGQGHTSWLMPYALPKFFVKEKPVVVEFNEDIPGNANTLYTLWNRNEAFFDPRLNKTLHYWKGPDARLLGKQVGFDYMVVVPEEEW